MNDQNSNIRKRAARCHKWGANVVAIKRGDKRPAHKWKAFQEKRQPEEKAGALPWRKAVGFGVVCGYGGWRCFDIDDCTSFAVVRALLDALGLPTDYPWVVKSGSGSGWHNWFRCSGSLPPDLLKKKSGNAGVRTGQPKEAFEFDHLELRWERCQTVLPPSLHPSGGRYEFANRDSFSGAWPEDPPAEVTAERVAEAVRAVCQKASSKVKAESNQREKPGGVGGSQWKKKARQQAAGGSGSDDVKRIKDALTASGCEALISFARRQYGRGTETEPNGDVRILGNGGLLIDPETGLWYRHQAQTGGDCLDFIGHARYGAAWDPADASMFKPALEEAAQTCGFELNGRGAGHARRNGRAKPRQQGGGAKVTPAAVPVAGVLASDVERQPIRWIWPGRLARGETTLLDGDPGLGKSTLFCDLAARITTGRPMPGEEKPLRDGPGGVVLVTTEDSPSHTIRPRLDAAGADPSKVRIVQSVPTKNDDGSWSEKERVPILPDDLPVLKATAKNVDADLLVIDPLFAHLSGEVNTFKDSDVRSALAPLSAFAEEAGLAVVVIRHLNKRSGGSALYRGGGSIGIIGAARLAFAFGEDPENAGHLVLAPNKVNLGKMPPSLELCLQDSPGESEVACVKWLGTSDLSAQDLFNAKQKEPDSPALSEAKDFLREHLCGGPQRASEMYDAAEEAGIKKDTLKRARRELATAERTGGVGDSGYWQWVLAEKEKRQGEATSDEAPAPIHAADATIRPDRQKRRFSQSSNAAKKSKKVAESTFEANWPKNGTPGAEESAFEGREPNRGMGKDKGEGPSFECGQRVRTPKLEGTICDDEPGRNGRWPVRPDSDVNGEGVRYFDAAEITPLSAKASANDAPF